jgi:hypothetical protein
VLVDGPKSGPVGEAHAGRAFGAWTAGSFSLGDVHKLRVCQRASKAKRPKQNQHKNEIKNKKNNIKM